MTIDEFNSQMHYAEKREQELTNAQNTIYEVMSMIKPLVQEQTDITLIDDKLQSVLVTCDRAKQSLSEYSKLLKGISRNSVISWPPTVHIEDES